MVTTDSREKIHDELINKIDLVKEVERKKELDCDRNTRRSRDI